jgi:hypothetical protein
MAAAREGHLEVVRLLLDRGADPNAMDDVSIHRNSELSDT